MGGPIDGKKRATLVAELDGEAKWFQRAARRYRTREWARDIRRALRISLEFLADETQLNRSTIYRAEGSEKAGNVTIGELEALAGAMECKLVYAIVPERGTVAELVERRKGSPRKTRSVREKETKEYMEQYKKEVERIRMRDRRNWTSEMFQKDEEERNRREQERLGLRTDEPVSGEGVVSRPPNSPGVQKLIDDIGRYDMGRMTIEKIKRDLEERERKGRRQGTGNRE